VCEFVDAGSAGELFRLADAALLLAKARGRDMTVRYEAGVLDRADGEAPLQRAERARTLAALRALARAVDARDSATQRHSERVADLTHRIAREMGWHDDRAMALREAALVHDVGKIGIADQVLRKPGRLTPEEFRQVAAHPDLGAAIVTEVLSAEQVAWVRHHHERLDGEGYPGRLSGTAIPQGARILAAADAWDAMTTDRPYRSALSPEAAMAECSRVAGSQLDREVVAVMERLVAAGALPEGDALGAWAMTAAADAAY
jgi:HD-GYP domain-containing protein (c-di-GMP phosphodiesterase class II)